MRFSLGFTAVVALLSLVGWVIAELRWQGKTLTPYLTFEPHTIVWLARGFFIFAALMLLSNVVEWKKLRSTA